MVQSLIKLQNLFKPKINFLLFCPYTDCVSILFMSV